MTLPELLRRWAELEPEMLEPIGGTDFTVRFDEGTAWIPVDPTLGLYAIDTAILCAVIEAAIVERGWILRVSANAPKAGDFWVQITEPDKLTTGNLAFNKGVTKLEALLSAYVQALEAMK